MTGRALAKEAILTALGQGAQTTHELTRVTGRTSSRVATHTCALVRQGLVERMERGLFRLTQAGERLVLDGDPLTSGPKGPRSGHIAPLMMTFRQRAWNAMRLLVCFTAADIVLRASGSDEANAAGNLQKYLRGLVAAGYVRDSGRRERNPGQALTSNGLKVYRLVKDTGDIAPRLSRDGIVDFNGGRHDRLPAA